MIEINSNSDIERETLKVLSTSFNGCDTIALLDFPNHQNSGDTLIWMGTRKYLARIGVRVGFACDILRYDPDLIRKRVPQGPIVLHGGGNLGDRWTQYQEFRERVILDFPDREVIQFPQSVEFSEGPRLERAKRIFSAHPNLTIMIRDQISLAKAVNWFPSSKVIFCPDLAYGVGSVSPIGEPSVDVVAVRRGDSEGVQPEDFYVGESALSIEYADWGLTGTRAARWKALHIPGAIWTRMPWMRRFLAPAMPWVFDRLAKICVDDAIAIVSRGRFLLTDRLHAAILASVMDKSVVVLNNANGKISSIHNDYLGSSGPVHFAQDVVEASGQLDELIASI